MTAADHDNIRFWLYFILPPVLLGVILRLYGLGDQILLDDEWHSINFVLNKSFFEALTTHGLGANSIPQNLYNWLALHTIGWSEMTLRFPSLLFGIASLILFPLLVWRITTRGTAVAFSCLLAVSPAAIFYSRIARPFSGVLFFGFLSLLCAALALRDGNRKWLYAYAVSGFLAIYHHLYAVIPVGAAGIGLLALHLFRNRLSGTAARIPALKDLMTAGALIVVLCAVFLVPAHVANPWWTQVIGTSRVTPATLINFLSLISGTHVTLLSLVFAGLVLYGLIILFRRDPAVGALFISLWVAFVLLLAFATQEGMHAAIQIARYCLIYFPVAFVLIGIALDQWLALSRTDLSPASGMLLVAVLTGILLIGSPLWTTFARPNNFMHHSAFQDSYRPMDWSRSRIRDLTPLPQTTRERIPPFYFDTNTLAGVAGIIEYPVFIGDPINLYYYYQHFHRRPVAAGYLPEIQFAPTPSGEDYVYQITPVDYVLSRAAASHKGAIRFRNLVSLSDPVMLSRTHKDWIIVVHRDLFREMLGLQTDPPGWIYPPSGAIKQHLLQVMGQPVFSDEVISVWRIP